MNSATGAHKLQPRISRVDQEGLKGKSSERSTNNSRLRRATDQQREESPSSGI